MLDDKAVLAECVKVVNSSFVGMMTTTDRDGVPHARWMGTSTAAEGVHVLYTLTAKGSRKLDQLGRNAAVCWVFTSDEYRDVVTLYGTAELMTSPTVVQSVWDRLMDAARTFAMRSLGEKQDVEFVTIETRVQRVEFLSPRLEIFEPRIIEFAPAS